MLTVMLLADLMTFKVKFESVSQHVMLLADLMTFKVRFESVSQHFMLLADSNLTLNTDTNFTLNVIRSVSNMTC
jgi:hypothetical protein